MLVLFKLNSVVRYCFVSGIGDVELIVIYRIFQSNPFFADTVP